jgi:hypothetical protein
VKRYVSPIDTLSLFSRGEQYLHMWLVPSRGEPGLTLVQTSPRPGPPPRPKHALGGRLGLVGHHIRPRSELMTLELRVIEFL